MRSLRTRCLDFVVETVAHVQHKTTIALIETVEDIEIYTAW